MVRPPKTASRAEQARTWANTRVLPYTLFALAILGYTLIAFGL